MSEGGHVFDFKCRQADVYLQCCNELQVKLPLTQQFDTLCLKKDTDVALLVAERGQHKT